MNDDLKNLMKDIKAEFEDAEDNGIYGETLESAGCTGGCPTYHGAPKTPDGSPDCSKCPSRFNRDFEGEIK